MTRILKISDAAYGREVVVDRSLVEDLIAAAGQKGFTARELGEVADTPSRRVAIKWKGKLNFDEQRETKKRINSFLDEWDAGSG